MMITYQERIREDGDPVSVLVVPPSTMMDEIEVIMVAVSVAGMTNEQAAVLSAHLAEEVTSAGVVRNDRRRDQPRN